MFRCGFEAKKGTLCWVTRPDQGRYDDALVVYLSSPSLERVRSRSITSCTMAVFRHYVVPPARAILYPQMHDGWPRMHTHAQIESSLPAPTHRSDLVKTTHTVFVLPALFDQTSGWSSVLTAPVWGTIAGRLRTPATRSQ